MSLPKREIVKGPYLNGSGYMYVDVYEPETGRKYKTPHHRFVVEEHKGERLKEGYVVHHKDGRKTNNDIDNLQVMTRTAHNKHHREWRRRRRKTRRVMRLNKSLSRRKRGVRRRIR